MSNTQNAMDAPPLFTSSDLPSFHRGGPAIHAPGPVRSFRQRSRSFDGAFLKELSWFHQMQPAQASTIASPRTMHMQQQQQHNMQQQQAAFLHSPPQQHRHPSIQPALQQQHSSPFPNTALANVMSATVPIPPRSGRVSPTSGQSLPSPTYPTSSRRERLLREAYLSPRSSAVIGNSPRGSRQGSRPHSPTGPPSLRSSRSAANSPRASSALHLYHAQGMANQNGFVALSGPMMSSTSNVAAFDMLASSSSHTTPTRQGLLPNISSPSSPASSVRSPPLLTHRVSLLSAGLAVPPGGFPSHNAAGQAFYGFINTGAQRSQAPPGQPMEQQAQPPGSSDGSPASKSGGSTGGGEKPPHRRVPSTLLQLHDSFVEVKDDGGAGIGSQKGKHASGSTGAKRNSGGKDKSPHVSRHNSAATLPAIDHRGGGRGSGGAKDRDSSSREGKGEEKEKHGPAPSASPPPQKEHSVSHASIASAVSSPSSSQTETYEQRLARESKKAASAAQAAKDAQAKKNRIARREQALLAKQAEIEAERIKAEQAEKARAARVKQEKLKQREALAEAAQRRARQTEKTKESEAILKAREEKQRREEEMALARLRSQNPISHFNPTLAYALKVESSASIKDRVAGGKRLLRDREGSVIKSPTTVAGAGSALAINAREVEEKHQSSSTVSTPHPPRSDYHTRKPSLYDGSDWDELHSLAASSSERGVGSVDGGSIHEEDEDGEDHEDDEHEHEHEHDGDGENDDEGAADGEGDDTIEEGADEVADDTADGDEGEEAQEQHQQQQTKSSSSQPTPSSTTPVVSSRPQHSRTLSSVAREHVAREFTKISTKHVVAKKQLQALRKEARVKLLAQVSSKREKSDQIKQARQAELKRMQAAMDAQIANEEAAAKAASYVLAMKLAKAAKDGDCDRIRALASDPAETEGDIVKWVNRHDSAGSTAIFHATWTAAIPALELLFRLGAEVNAINNRHNTALHLACDRAHYPVIRLLVHQGANPLLKNHERNAPFEMQSRNSAESLEMALYLRQCLEDLILEQGEQADLADVQGAGMANVTVTADDSETPLSSPTNQQASLTPHAPSTPSHHLAISTGSATAADTLASPRSNLSGSASPNAGRRLKTPQLDPLKRGVSYGMDAALLVANAKEHLVGINSYITARIQLSQSMRRIKMKIWTAIRFSRNATPRVSTDAGSGHGVLTEFATPKSTTGTSMSGLASLMLQASKQQTASATTLIGEGQMSVPEQMDESGDISD